MAKDDQKATAKTEPKGAVRTTRIEVSEFLTDDPQGTKKRWLNLCDRCQEVMNFLWQRWEVWHVTHDSPSRIRGYLDDLSAWRERHAEVLANQGKPKESKPKCEVVAIPKSLVLDEKLLTASFPEIHKRTLGLLQNKFREGVQKRKAANGNLSGWMSILLNREGRPSFTKPVPVPFDHQNSKIVPPDADCDKWRMRLRIDRVETGKKTASSTEDFFELLTHKAILRGGKVVGKKPLSVVSILERIASGEYKFCGSSIVWNASKRKWFVHISWQRTKAETAANLDRSHVAILRAGDSRPWILEIGEVEYWWLAGDGKHISGARQMILRQRWERQDNYRYSGSASKGHGRRRATVSWAKLEQRWKNVVKSSNHNLTCRVVDAAVKAGVGTVIYQQPDGDYRDTRFLATAGKIRHQTKPMPMNDAEKLAAGKRKGGTLGVEVLPMDGGQAIVRWYRNDASGWDWHQVASMLHYKCQDAGIHLIVRKEGGEGEGGGGFERSGDDTNGSGVSLETGGSAT